MSRDIPSKPPTPASDASNAEGHLVPAREAAWEAVAEQKVKVKRITTRLETEDFRPEGENGHFISESSDPRDFRSSVEAGLADAEAELLKLQTYAEKLQNHNPKDQA